MKVVYVAGKYTAPTCYEVKKNIDNASKVAEWAWSNGYAAITPHMNTAFLDGLCEYDIWMNGYLNILERCDLVILVPGWENSNGAKEEVRLARFCGIPVYEYFDESTACWAGIKELKI